MIKFTAAQTKALKLAMTTSGGCVYAGYNINNGCRMTIGANTLRSLAALGLMIVDKTTAGETYARITAAGVEAARS